MRRTVKWIPVLILLALLAPYRAGALGLGDIKLNSYLNQPLDAEISVLPSDQGELGDARIGLAPNAAFEKAGIERRSVLDQIIFKVVKGDDGKPRIELTSTDPIKEPFLDFILQVTWPKGQLLREYTVLLDPPVTTAEPAPPVQPAVTGAGQTATETTSPATTAAATSAEPQQTAGTGEPPAPVPTRDISAKLTKEAYGPIQRSDTLWSIAKSVRPDTSVSIQQVMLALVKQNPDAFYSNNVNTLKAGYILRLPDLALINQVDEAEAIREVKRQYQQWLDMKSGKIPMGSTPSQDASPGNQAETGAGTGAGPDGAEQARLKLLPPDAAQASAGGGGTSAAASTQDRLASAQEANEAQKQENESLRAKIDELNDQVTSMQRLLALKDDTLTVLQNKLSQLQNVNSPVAPSGQQENPVAGQQNSASPQPAPVPQSAQATQAAPKPKPATPPPPAVVKPPAHATPKAPTRGRLFSDPKILSIGGAVVVVLGVVVWLVIRRRQMRSEALVPGIATETAMAETQAEASPAAAGGETYAPTGGDLLEAEVNEIDPLAEADVYMAYRRYQQAEELLKGAIDQEPNRLELRLKLLEVFAAGENTEAFVSEAENFYNERGGRDNPLWEKVAAMGREVQPEHPLFATEGDVPAGGADAVEDATPVALEDDELEDDELFNTMLEPQSVDEPAASDDVLQSNEPDITEELASIEEEQDEAEEEEQDLAIEFESGLDKKLPERPATEEKSQGGEFKTGFEIDFDTSPGTGATTKARRQGQEAEETLDDALGDAVTSNLEEGLSLDAIDGFEDMEQSSEETGLDFVTDAATPDNNNTPGDGDAGEIQGLESVEEGDTSEQGDTKLDFEFKMGSLATKDKDLEDFFEGLDSVDGGDDGAGGHEEVGTKLDLAKAFIEMGDQDGARDILKEVVDHGNDEQKEEARSLLEQL